MEADQTQPETERPLDKWSSYDAAVQYFSEMFDSLCNARHRMGEEKYGHNTFEKADTLRMAMEELADFANYAKYTFVKLALLQERLGGTLPEPELDLAHETTAAVFVSVRDILGKKEQEQE